MFVQVPFTALQTNDSFGRVAFIRGAFSRRLLTLVGVRMTWAHRSGRSVLTFWRSSFHLHAILQGVAASEADWEGSAGWGQISRNRLQQPLRGTSWLIELADLWQGWQSWLLCVCFLFHSISATVRLFGGSFSSPLLNYSVQGRGAVRGNPGVGAGPSAFPPGWVWALQNCKQDWCTVRLTVCSQNIIKTSLWLHILYPANQISLKAIFNW